MQTFLPHLDYGASARSLDRQRLGKQRSENLQIMCTLFGLSDGWHNHPVIRMWYDHEGSLLMYHVAIVEAWLIRGYKDTTYQKAFELYAVNPLPAESYLPPTWLGDPDFHMSHQSNLIRKDSSHYLPQFPGVPDDLPYIWPVSDRFD